ncbi:MAG: PglZ domain-containing protein [Bacteroidales bacterium]|nr:PglZ domain-containing protein [Bacteroidales bacterium]MCF8344176.1 PglZ domain-containing protein [Bacteroidales bacterium]MCF8350824.1 PglZ domain-containing protein [Bacteroidales bacterium]MCF8375387.1 PglZ domain-containing protein [Bacteroidales bacterium]MCF8401274.1 PglZ domain-containing protein [Bacteroidales bacterium]
MEQIKILWADDEIDLLKPHIIFLEQKGYEVHTTNNGGEALDLIRSNPYDIVFLDEHMPGLSGIETLEEVKRDYPGLPVVMITKSEEESIMEDAIGSNISDYLIKPVKPNQILLSLKKNLENKKLVSEKATHSYQQEFRSIGMDMQDRLGYQDWVDIYRKLIRYELELEKSKDEGIQEVLKSQKEEANMVFSKFYENNYLDWISPQSSNRPVLSHTLVRERVLPRAENNDKPFFVIVIDNLRYDQWKAIQPMIEEYFRVETDEIYYSILPTTTQYARNALFSGLLPSEIQKRFPNYWTNEWEEGTKNQYEGELMIEQLKRFGKNFKTSYNKVLNLNAGNKLYENLPNLMNNRLNFIVYNFVDMLSHARTEMEIIRELADDEAAYRSLMLSWFEHSSLFDILKWLSEKQLNIAITTDHGSVQVSNPVKIVGDRETNTNLRYKYGRSLNYNKKEVFEGRNPEDLHLPRANVSTSFVFCRKNDFFAYPNNYNYYVNYYKNTFQHGGISMEEILIPFITLKAR